MAISDLLNAREFPVDRDAYRYLDRYVPFNYPSVNVLATSSHFQYDRTVKDCKEQVTDRTHRIHKNSASHYYIRVQCVTVRSISADRNYPHA